MPFCVAAERPFGRIKAKPEMIQGAPPRASATYMLRIASPGRPCPSPAVRRLRTAQCAPRRSPAPRASVGKVSRASLSSREAMVIVNVIPSVRWPACATLILFSLAMARHSIALAEHLLADHPEALALFDRVGHTFASGGRSGRARRRNSQCVGGVETLRAGGGAVVARRLVNLRHVPGDRPGSVGLPGRYGRYDHCGR